MDSPLSPLPSLLSRPKSSGPGGQREDQAAGSSRRPCPSFKRAALNRNLQTMSFLQTRCLQHQLTSADPGASGRRQLLKCSSRP